MIHFFFFFGFPGLPMNVTKLLNAKTACWAFIIRARQFQQDLFPTRAQVKEILLPHLVEDSCRPKSLCGCRAQVKRM